MNLRPIAFVSACALVLAGGCAATSGPDAPRSTQGNDPYQIMNLGEHFETPKGNVFIIRVQDEFKLIRCIPDGPIAGCYEDLLVVPEEGLAWNEWVSVQGVPGLTVAFLSPVDFALRFE